MKIGFDAKRIFFNRTGLGNFGRTLVSEMHRQFPQDELVLFTPTAPLNALTEPFFPPDFTHVLPATDIGLLSSWWRSVGLGPHISRSGVDVYHGLSQELPLIMPKKPVRTIVTVHDLVFLRLPQYYNPIDRNIYRQKVAHAVHKADAVVAISQRTRKDILEYFRLPEAKVHVIYQGCHPQFRLPVSDDDLRIVRNKYNLVRPYIIALGTVETRKNQLTIAKAFCEGELWRTHDLILAGRETRYARSVRRYLDEKGHAQHVHWIGHVLFSELPAMLRGASLSVYASEYEGFGLPVLESLCAGTPVLAASGSCLEETGGPAARYFTPHNVRELAALMKETVSNNALRAEMVSAGKSHCLTFSNDAMAQGYRKIYG